MGSNFGKGTVLAASEIAERGFEGRSSQADKANTLRVADLTTITHHIHPSDMIDIPTCTRQAKQFRKLVIRMQGQIVIVCDPKTAG